jgi:hypothetical protein
MPYASRADLAEAQRRYRKTEKARLMRQRAYQRAKARGEEPKEPEQEAKAEDAPDPWAGTDFS